MEIQEAEAGDRRREHWKLLYSLKTTVEGLLSTNNPNVWSRYGGLQRLHKDMNNILSHGLKHDQVYCKQKDYWRFVWCVRRISPHLAEHVEKFSRLEPVLGLSSGGEGHKAERWLLHSLQVHCLSAQLRPLLCHAHHTRKYYNEGAFLLSEPHVSAMFQCLEAVEQNDPRLLALIDTGRLSHLQQTPLCLLKTQGLCALPGLRDREMSCPPHIKVPQRHNATNSTLMEKEKGVSFCHSVSGAPWMCGVGQQDSASTPLGPPMVPHISLTEPSSPAWIGEGGEGVEAGEADFDDGPEYLAIGNLGQCRRRGSANNSTTSDQVEGSVARRCPLATSPRRSSFSEGQGPDRCGGAKQGHVRSLSDTGVMQKRSNAGGHRSITIIIEDPVAESRAEVCGAKEYSAFSPQSSEDSSPSSLYMESDGSQNSSVSDGMFRRPSEGQSLISYLSEQDFGSCADLEKENAHFSISESLIAAIELMKCNLRLRAEAEEEEESDSEIQQLKQKIRLRRQQIRKSRQQPAVQSQHTFPTSDSGDSRHSSQDSLHLSDSGSAEEVEECELRDGSEGGSLLAVSRSGLSLSLASLFSAADIKRNVAGSTNSRSFLSSDSPSHSFLQSNSAESVAMGLLRQFEGMQLPAASELEWLVPEHDAPQKLLPIPDSLPISPDDGEHADIYKLRIRVRGNLEWAPPRPQIIFNIHPAPKRKVVVAKQNYRCAGCGTRVDPDYIKRLRYCEYLGRYFCQCCHENSQAVVPGRVLRRWDFSKQPVSNFARDLLGKIAGDPLFNLQDINSALYRKVKALEQVRLLRLQLFHMKNMFKTCRLAKEVLNQFDLVPGHLTEDLHLFSLNDLSAVRSGDLPPRLRELLRLGSTHVSGCMLCQAKGFVCEFCGNDKDIIFPFELNKCRRCEDCKACYHRACFRGERPCPKCQRLAERRERLARRNMEELQDEGEDEGGGK
ncbi:run domain Beclin-1-interacting and cysteine-rich domain-containing protein isoform X1 [Lepisosteus oculatus]|uniref:run domain Beclin-1-interacting and cysteine-rich domain-containing protein isoform X1 n=1 Tax=Lepisosteus oculatus TaxID=7918 RepID=UPI0035F50828